MAVKARGDITLIRVDDGAAGEDGQMLYATSSTAESTAAKAATLAAGTLNLKAGVTVAVRFTYSNTAASPMLNVAGTGAKAIYTQGVRYAYWTAGATVIFTYDGTNWRVSSEPVYANTATIGNPAGGNIYLDGDSIDLRAGSNVMAQFGVQYVSGSPDMAFLKAVYGLYIGTKAITESGSATAPHLSIYDTVETHEGEVGIKKKFSTSEFNTRETWVDGKEIYQKTFHIGAITSGTRKIVNHGISNLSEIWVDLSNSFLKASTGGTYMLPRVTSIALNQMVEVIATKTQILIDPGSDANFSDCYVTLRYTKLAG